MSVYVNPIANGILVSSLIIYLAFIPILIRQYRRYGALRMRGNLILASFIVYMITAWFMTVMPLPSFEAVRNMEPIRPNFRPFLFAETFLRHSGFILSKPGTWFTAMRSASFFTVAFNVLLTVPFGIYLRKYFKFGLPLTAASGLILSLFYEATQYSGLFGIYPQAYRFADVDDLIVNTAGAAAGYFLAGRMEQLLPDPAKDHRMLAGKVSVLRRLLSLLVDFIAVGILYELIRVAVYRNELHREWDLSLFLVSEAVVFAALPLLTGNKQTAGMRALRLHFQDSCGQDVATSRILLHNLFVGLWIFIIHGTQGTAPVIAAGIILFQLLSAILLVIMVIKSLSQRRICYYWETWLDAYLKADLPE